MSRLNWIVIAPFIFVSSLSSGHLSTATELPTTIANVDQYGDPLPRYALDRLGTIRYRHSAGIKSLQFSPGGKTLATVGYDQSVCLWRFPSGKLMRRLADVDLDYHKAAFSPDGKKLLVACSEMKQFKGCFLQVVDLETDESASLPVVHEQAVQRLFFAGDGQEFCSISPDCITSWDARTYKSMVRWHWNAPTGVIAVAPKQNVAAFASSRKKDPLLRLQKVENGEIIKDIPGIETELRDARTGEVKRTVFKPQQPVVTMAFSRDGSRLATGSPYVPIRVWNLSTGKVVQTLHATKGAVVVCFSPDGKYIASANVDGLVQLWSAATGKCLRNLTGYSGWPNALQFSPDSKTVALAGDSSRTVHLWNVSSGKSVCRECGHIGTIRALAFADDGQRLLSIGSPFGETTAVCLWKRDTRHNESRMKPANPMEQNMWYRDVSITADAGAAYFPDERLPAIHQLHTESGKVTWGIQKQAAALDDTKPGSVILSVALDAKNDLLATGSSDGTICLSHRLTGKIMRLWETENAGITSLEFSSDGKYLISVNERRGVCLWEAATGKKIREFGKRTDMIEQVCISPDNKFVAALSQWHKGKTYWWNLESGKDLHRFAKLDEKLHCITFSPNGRMLVVAGEKGVIRLYEVQTGKLRCCFKGHSGSVSALAFSADGLQLASGGADTSVLLWDVSADGLKTTGAWRTSDANLAKLSQQLGSDDAQLAYQAMWKLVSAAKQSRAFLQAKVRPLPIAGEKEIRQLIKQLNHDDYRKRASAMKQLTLLGAQAEDSLRQAYEQPMSPEARRRITTLLKKLEYSEIVNESLLNERVQETLQWIAVTEKSASFQTK